FLFLIVLLILLILFGGLRHYPPLRILSRRPASNPVRRRASFALARVQELTGHFPSRSRTSSRGFAHVFVVSHCCWHVVSRCGHLEGSDAHIRAGGEEDAGRHRRCESQAARGRTRYRTRGGRTEVLQGSAGPSSAHQEAYGVR